MSIKTSVIRILKTIEEADMAVIEHTDAWFNTRNQENITMSSSVLANLTNYSMTITPAKAGNIVVPKFHLSIDTGAQDLSFFMLRNGSLLPNGGQLGAGFTDASATAYRTWGANMVPSFDTQFSLSPTTYELSWPDLNSLAIASVYSIGLIYHNGSSADCTVNRSRNSTGQNGFPNSASWGQIKEFIT